MQDEDADLIGCDSHLKRIVERAEAERVREHDRDVRAQPGGQGPCARHAWCTAGVADRKGSRLAAAGSEIAIFQPSSSSCA
jgi:hypothetical protein